MCKFSQLEYISITVVNEILDLQHLLRYFFDIIRNTEHRQER